ncbi:hypothetical protein BUALT_Bualt18G0049000 [Buddleja alternifolia]|uniref:Uncharacterized protein n=1 Tax=Buddleja alternifolia TaxID=168488 RepID=A0AAV6WAJ2_9LAMI|nr:hypothetical protein BUALT_Bualt18G0049000 [Buddleja alternifolia]
MYLALQGVMKCPECKGKLPIRISADDVRSGAFIYSMGLFSDLFVRSLCSEDVLTQLSEEKFMLVIFLLIIPFPQIMEPPWKAYNILRKMDYPYEHIVDSMKDPSIAAFWLITLPQIVGGIDYDDDVKQKIWWQYKESMRYDQLRGEVAKRKPGWEYLQEALFSIDPVRAKEDPVIVKNIPYFKAKKALETEVLKFNPPPRPPNWGELDLPLNASSWTEEDLKDPKKLYEMTVLLNAQREIADKILDAQWETKWREEKLNEMLKEKVEPYLQNIDNSVLPQPILLQSQRNQDQKVCLSLVLESKADDDGGCFDGLWL